MSRVIFFDGDSGRGGASRSLLAIAPSLPAAGCDPIIVVSQENMLRAEYEGLRVPVVPVARFPRYRPTARHNWYGYVRYLTTISQINQIKDALRNALGGKPVDLVHANHENVALGAQRLARALGVPWSCHVRTQLEPNMWSRWLYRRIARDAAAIVFISHENHRHFFDLTRPTAAGGRVAVIYNAFAPAPQAKPEAPAEIERHRGFKVLTLSNFSPNRGIDRMIDVAVELAALGRRDIKIFLAGQHTANVSLRSGGRAYIDLVKQAVSRKGLTDIVHFLGHITAGSVLPAVDVLVRPSRQANPWGRDIIEAMSHGIPVIASGTYQNFVENGVNGFIDAEFDAKRVAGQILRLESDIDLRQRIRRSNIEKANRLFNPSDRAADLARIFEAASGRHLVIGREQLV